MKLSLSLVTVFALTFAACAKKETAAVDQYGSCKQSVVDSYNTITGNAKLFLNTNDSSYLKTASAECASFNALLGGQSCNLLIDGEKTTITKANVESLCSAIDHDLKLSERKAGTSSASGDSGYAPQRDKKRTGSKKPKTRKMENAEDSEAADIDLDASAESIEAL